MTKELYLLRGVPGAGKSTLAKSIGGVHLETDMYFKDPVTGEYKFDPSKLRVAHQWCQDRVEGYLSINEAKVIVSNTFTQEWEMEAYTKMAAKYGYTVFSLIVENRHGGVNEHGVPEEALDRMEKRFEIKLR